MNGQYRILVIEEEEQKEISRENHHARYSSDNHVFAIKDELSDRPNLSETNSSRNMMQREVDGIQNKGDLNTKSSCIYENYFTPEEIIMPPISLKNLSQLETTPVEKEEDRLIPPSSPTDRKYLPVENDTGIIYSITYYLSRFLCYYFPISLYNNFSII